jgi:hypothetical protein
MSEEAFYSSPKIREVGSDILHLTFMTREYVDYVLEACKAVDSWAPNKHDRRYSTYDIHLNEELPSIYEAINDHLNTVIWPMVALWWGVEGFEVSNMFALKYSADTQTSLKLHHDDSYITASVKLNDDYDGAELIFPTKGKFSNKYIPVGDLLVWPGSITHAHKCTDLWHGEKYSLTIWTKQTTN